MEAPRSWRYRTVALRKLSHWAGGDRRTPGGTRRFRSALFFQRFPAAAAARKFCLQVKTMKNLPTMPETRVQSLGRENFPEKGTATRSSILA